MTNPSAVRNIPLSKLVLSPGNVRKTPPSPAEEAELKASIKARGLKQNRARRSRIPRSRRRVRR
jgi:ParB-like chromosome segregation protein Spo0J